MSGCMGVVPGDGVVGADGGDSLFLGITAGGDLVSGGCSGDATDVLFLVLKRNPILLGVPIDCDCNGDGGDGMDGDIIIVDDVDNELVTC